MNNYCIKGNTLRGKEVIAILESKGGKNICNYRGDCEDRYYYIDKNNKICASFVDLNSKLTIATFCEELTTGKMYKKMYMIEDIINLDKNIYDIDTYSIPTN